MKKIIASLKKLFIVNEQISIKILWAWLGLSLLLTILFYCLTNLKILKMETSLTAFIALTGALPTVYLWIVRERKKEKDQDIALSSLHKRDIELYQNKITELNRIYVDAVSQFYDQKSLMAGAYALNALIDDWLILAKEHSDDSEEHYNRVYQISSILFSERKKNISNQLFLIVTEKLVVKIAKLSHQKKGKFKYNFSKFDFEKASLENVNLENTDLHNIKLNNSNLNYSILTGVNLDNSNLSGSNLESSDMTGIHLDNANLSTANLSFCNLTRAYLSKADIVESNLDNTILENAFLSISNLSGTSLKKAYLSNTNCYGALFENANLSLAHLNRSNLTAATLINANLNNANLSHANLTDADLTNASLKGADLTGACFRNTIISKRAILEVKNITMKQLEGCIIYFQENKSYIKTSKYKKIIEQLHSDFHSEDSIVPKEVLIKYFEI